MILPPEKVQDLNTNDGRSRETEAPPIILEYHPESSSSSRPTTFPTSENALPPPYIDSFTRPAASASSSYFAPSSPNTMPVPSFPSSPVSFARVPPRNPMYPSFSPMFMIALGKTLDKGFPYTSPPSNSHPHPFASHDVYEEDWLSFLQEARKVATLTDKQLQLSHLPIVSLVPIVNQLACYGVKQILKHRNASKVVDCIDKWNRHFFEPRKMKIVLMKGQVKVSGQNEYLNHTATPNSNSNPKSEYDMYEDHPPPSAAGISQELIGKNDDVYRLFVVPLL